MTDKIMHKLMDEHTWEVKEMEVCTGCGEIRNPPGVSTLPEKIEIMKQRARAFEDKCESLEKENNQLKNELEKYQKRRAEWIPSILQYLKLPKH